MIHYIIAIIFFLFAAVQINDPDGWLWIPVYLVVAAVPILYQKKMIDTARLLIVGILYFIAVLVYVPDLIDWIKGGMPSIAESMAAESPFIEFVREFFGLSLCLATIIGYYLLQRGRKNVEV